MPLPTIQLDKAPTSEAEEVAEDNAKSTEEPTPSLAARLNQRRSPEESQKLLSPWRAAVKAVGVAQRMKATSAALDGTTARKECRPILREHDIM